MTRGLGVILLLITLTGCSDTSVSGPTGSGSTTPTVVTACAETRLAMGGGTTTTTTTVHGQPPPTVVVQPTVTPAPVIVNVPPSNSVTVTCTKSAPVEPAP